MGGPVGRVPEADALPAGGEIVALDEVGELREGRRDRAFDRRADLGGDPGAVGLGPVGGEPGDDPPQGALLGLRDGQRPELGDGLGHRDPGGDPTLGHPLPHHDDRGIDGGGEGAQPSQVVLEVAHRRHRVEVDGLRELQVEPFLLADRDQVVAEPLAGELVVERREEHVAVDPLVRARAPRDRSDRGPPGCVDPSRFEPCRRRRRGRPGDRRSGGRRRTSPPGGRSAAHRASSRRRSP